MTKAILRVHLAVVLLFGCMNPRAAWLGWQTDDLLIPSIVHVVRDFSGTARIPYLYYDSDADKVTVAGDKALAVEYKERLAATGFIVHPDGVIVTDRFIASTDAIKSVLARKYVLNVLKAGWPDSAGFDDVLVLHARNFLAEHITLENGVDDVLVEGSTFARGGIRAKIVNSEHVHSTGNTPAILRINMDNLPSLKIREKGWSDDDYYLDFYYEYGSAPEGSTGDGYSINKIYTYDPATTGAEHFSGGSAVFADDREVMGMLMFDTKTDRQVILLGRSIVKALKTVGVKDRAGNYKKSVMEGIQYMEHGSCRLAMGSFNRAIAETNADVAKHVAPYIQQCRIMLMAGKSTDTFSGFFRSVLGSPFMYYIFGTFIVVLFAYGLMALRNRTLGRS